jgi:hypothetical protein
MDVTERELNTSGSEWGPAASSIKAGDLFNRLQPVRFSRRILLLGE